MALIHPRGERWWSAPMAVLLPPLCQLCDVPVAPDVLVCTACVGRWSFIGAGCFFCAGGGMDTPACERCLAKPPPWHRAHSMVIYEDAAAEAIQAVKFKGRRTLAYALGALMGEFVGAWAQGPPQLLTWVPVSRARLRTRGFDQGRALADGVGLRLGMLPVATLRRRAGQTQSGKGRSRRGENTQAAFVPGPGVEAALGRTVLLVDDVLTTGATAATCTEQLLAAGASRVEVITFARAP